MNGEHDETNYRWTILILAALTNTLTVAAPSMCMPVLFEEIRGELGLSLSQVGLVWGIGALPGIFMVLVGGILGDQLGPKRVLVMACLLAGLAGALRGLSTNLITLAATVVLYGLVASVIPMNSLKMCGLWFSRRQLGLASGVVSMGMAFGFLMGTMISATLLSPWLGGWRNVLLLYGLIAMTFSIPWYFTRPAPVAVDLSAGETKPKSLRQTMAHVARIRKIWLMGWAILGIGGCIQGALGYLPLYLRDMGWPEASADGAAASFHMASMILVVPIALWSDKLGSRKKVLMVASFMIATGVGLLSVVDGVMVWMAVIMAGMVRDGFMAVFLTMIIETEGIGPAYAGTATGLVMVFSGLGSLLTPPLGNSLAKITPGLPFIFWAGLTVVGFFGIYAAKEERAESALVIQPAGQVG
jgi:MFS family permease